MKIYPNTKDDGLQIVTIPNNNLKIYTINAEPLADVQISNDGNYHLNNLHWVTGVYLGLVKSAYVVVYNYNNYLPNTEIRWLCKFTYYSGRDNEKYLAWYSDDDLERQGGNVFYYIIGAHDYFVSTPINFATMNYQINAYVDYPTSLYFSNAAAIVGGEEIRFADSSDAWAKTRDIIVHEYSHCVLFKLFPDGTGISGGIKTNEAYAMDEGFADFFAADRHNDSIMGEGTGVILKD